jgi:uncharacterized protein YbaR (Trm112 family)
MIICPLCHGPFGWEIGAQNGDDILEARLHCPSCGILAGVFDGLGVFLPGDAVPVSAGPGPAGPLRVTPEAGPVRGAPLGGAFQKAVEQSSRWVADQLGARDGPLLELAARASGVSRTLVSVSGERPIVSRFDLLELESLRRRWRLEGVPDGWDGVVFEPHSIPFAHRSIGTAVTELGLQELPGPLVVLRELRRVVTGRIYAVMAFLEVADGGGNEGAQPPPLPTMFFESSCLETFRKARWKARFEPVGLVRFQLEDVGSWPEEGGPARSLEGAECRVGVVVAE